MSRAKRLQSAISAIEDDLVEISDLRDEIQEWHNNMAGTNLENTQKYSDLETCDELLTEQIEAIEEALKELENVEFPTMFS